MFCRTLAALSLFAGLLLHPAVASANDSSAEFGIGGLVLARSSSVEMVSEDLYISRSKVSVEYVFRNISSEDVNTIVAFPIPALPAYSGDLNISLPFYDKGANFVGFTTSVDGQPVRTKVEQRALAAGVDRTDLLKRHGIPLTHFEDAVLAKLKALPKDVVADWETKGLVRTLNGVEPAWDLKTTFYWAQKFPKGQDVKIAHTYAPVTGAAAFSGLAEAPEIAAVDYRKRYCVDAETEKSVKALQAERKKLRDADKSPKFYLTDERLEYILKTGANWAGPIKRFRLVVDKGDEKSFVNFCGENVKKISPTRYEMVKEDFYPQNDLRVIFTIYHSAED